MRELDLLLGGWLERRWAVAPDRARASFEWLLGQPDGELAHWLLGGGRPPAADHASLVDEIVRCRD
jgi:succinate dehydrogenase flavin-adding protein (antitoxin of CptAB toxin-antitoxin module)